MKERSFVHTASDCTCYTIGRADRPEKSTGHCMLYVYENGKWE